MIKNKNIKLLILLFLIFILMINVAYAQNNLFKRIYNTILESNIEIKSLNDELKALDYELKSNLKTSPINLDVESEYNLGDIEEGKRYQLSNFEINKDFNLSELSNSFKKKVKLEYKLKVENVKKNINDLLYEFLKELVQLFSLYCKKCIKEFELQLSKDLIEASKTKYEISLESKLQFEQVVLDYELANLNFVDALNEFNNKYELIKNKYNVPLEQSLLNKAIKLEKIYELIKKYSVDKINTLDFFLNLSMLNSYDIKVAQYEAEILKYELKLTKKSSLPEFKISAYRSINDFDEIERGIRFGMTFPLIDFNKRKNEILNLTTLNLNNYKLEQVKIKIRCDILEKYSNLIASQKKLQQIYEKIITKSEQILKMAKTGYLEKVLSFYEFQSIQKSYFELFNLMIDTVENYIILYLELRQACGILPIENEDIILPLLN